MADLILHNASEIFVNLPSYKTSTIYENKIDQPFQSVAHTFHSTFPVVLSTGIRKLIELGKQQLALKRKTEQPTTTNTVPSSSYDKKPKSSESNTAEKLFFCTYSPNGKRILHCRKCQKTFASKKNLNVHLIMHSGERTFKCRQCTMAFYTSSNLHSHERSHRNERPFQCKLCLKHFSRRRGLRLHTNRLHADVRTFVCQCGKSCTDLVELWNHEINCRHKNVNKPLPKGRENAKKQLALAFASEPTSKNGGRNNYACAQCGQISTTKVKLTEHLKSHMSESLFKCSWCIKGFNSKHELDEHVMIHGLHKPYGCDKCFKRFEGETTFLRHLKLHSTNREMREFKCLTCEKTFMRQDYLKRHAKIHEVKK